MHTEQIYLFETMPVQKAVIKLSLPSIMGQIILVIYNLADTYYVGLTGRDEMITAVTVCLPAFMFLSAISNLFGIGGGAAYSRALGRKNRKRCCNVASHALFGCIAVSAVYCLMAAVFRDAYVDLLGGRDALVHGISVQYLLITVVLGGMTTAAGAMLAHLIRADGHSASAGTGVILGGVLNILLDPLFMFVILPSGNEVLGAAIATALSNLASCIYFAAVIRKNSTLVFRYGEDAFRDGSMRELVMTGLPACMMTLLENISYAFLDALMAGYGIAAQAGVGVAKKINMLAHAIVRGLSQGVLPFFAYNYAAKNDMRLRKAFRLTAGSAVCVSAVLCVSYLLMAPQLVSLFILPQSRSLYYGIVFLRILCIGCPFSAFAYTVISFFQAVNRGIRSFFLAILRKGTADIPMMFLFRQFFGAKGITAATPAADLVCAGVSAVLITKWIKVRHRQAADIQEAV